MNRKKIITLFIVLLFIFSVAGSYLFGINISKNIVTDEEINKIELILDSDLIRYSLFLSGRIENILERRITVSGYATEEELEVEILPVAEIYKVYYLKTRDPLPDFISRDDLIGDPFIIEDIEYVSAQKEINFNEIRKGDDIFIEMKIGPDYNLQGFVVRTRDQGSAPIEI